MTSNTGEWTPATARSGSGGVARRAADAITNLAHENIDIKNMVGRCCCCCQDYTQQHRAHAHTASGCGSGSQQLRGVGEPHSRRVAAVSVAGAMQAAVPGADRLSCSGVLACLLIDCRLVLQVRADGGISPLVRLLSSWDLKVQRAAAGALRTLAFKNDDNKRQIVECGALPLLIQVGHQGGSACGVTVSRRSSVCLCWTQQQLLPDSCMGEWSQKQNMMVLAFGRCCFDTGIVLLRCCPQMLRSEDPGVHYEAVGVLGNLVHSSQEIKQQVLQVRGAGGRKAWRARQPLAALLGRRSQASIRVPLPG